MFPWDLKGLKIVSVKQSYILLYAYLPTELFYYFEDCWFGEGGEFCSEIVIRVRVQGGESDLRDC